MLGPMLVTTFSEGENSRVLLQTSASSALVRVRSAEGKPRWQERASAGLCYTSPAPHPCLFPLKMQPRHTHIFAKFILNQSWVIIILAGSKMAPENQNLAKSWQTWPRPQKCSLALTMPKMMGYTRPLAQYPSRQAMYKERLSCALLHKTEDGTAVPTQTARESHRVKKVAS